MQTEQIPVLKADEYPGGICITSRIHISLTVTYWAALAPTRWYALASTPAPPSPVRWTPP